jgi:hypothetical protein
LSRKAMLVAILLAATLSSRETTAQGSPSPDRAIHLIVCPRFGNDATALAWNPRLGHSPDLIARPKPHDHFNATYGDVLLYAPWPFKTITAAINYLPATTVPPLPDASAATSYVWRYAIIHVMPGLISPDTSRDPNSGFTGNGESFPIHLPPGVSIKGTSALNTMFKMPANGVGPIFEFGVTTAAGVEITGQDSFIDKISLYGNFEPTGNPGSHTPIYLSPGLQCNPTISNCFIFGNIAGIVLDAPVDPPSEPEGWHSPTIINNTFAWNQAGIWNGQFLAGASSVGISKPMLVNNVFDATPPTRNNPSLQLPNGWNAMGLSGFEGIDASDLTIAGIDYNAYEGNKFDLGIPIGFLPPTAPRTSAPASPGIDIAPWTSPTASQFRGVLFVRDLIFNGAQASGPFDLTPTVTYPFGFDLSPGDFRLAPAVAPADSAANPGPTPPAQVTTGQWKNPLVDAGWNGSFPVMLGNGMSILREPGKLVLNSQSSWEHHNWQEDCEGYGNPRIHRHPVYTPDAALPARIDIGADELGELVVAGTRFGTTNFLSMERSGSYTFRADNKYAWFLGVPVNHYNTNLNVVRPDYSMKWPGAPWTVAITSPAGTYAPTNADITPHLLPDNHPWWTGSIGVASNPFWEYWIPGWPMNPALYLTPSAGVIHPPGAWTQMNPNYIWLDFIGSPTPVMFGGSPVPPSPDTTGGAHSLVFDQSPTGWCTLAPQGQNPYDTFLPTTASVADQAIRFTIEKASRQIYTPSQVGSNLQSFLVQVD